MPMAPCKHLDYNEENYVGCAVRVLQGPDCLVRYWERGPTWTAGGNPKNVQFCGLGRGRINSITACYEAPGPMGCYEAETVNGEEP